MFQFFVTIFSILDKYLLQAIDTGMRFCIVLLLIGCSGFLFIFFTLSTCSFAKFSGYPLSLYLSVMMSQFLLNSEVVEHIVFMRNAWLYGILFLRDLR